MAELKCHCNTVIGMTEDEDEMLVPVYRYCKIHKNEDRSPFLAKDLDRLHGVRLNRAGMDFWRELKAEEEIKRQAANPAP